MALIINVLTAWTSVVLAILLSIVYILRIVNKGKGKDTFIGRLNRKLRNVHKPMGIAFVIIACVHGFFSSASILSFNFGTACMLIGVVLGATYWLRKIYKKQCSWCKPHRVLTAVLLIFLGVHLWEVGGIMGPVAFQTAAARELEMSVEKVYGREVQEEDLKEAVENDAKKGASESEDTGLENENNSELVEQQETSVPVETELESVEEIQKNLLMGTADIQDGTYTGVAEGYGPDLTVSVSVKDNQILSVEVVSHNENNVKYYGKAIDAVPEAIVSAQTPYVDTVSGATYTSNGIMQAVVNALEQGLVSGSLS